METITCPFGAHIARRFDVAAHGSGTCSSLFADHDVVEPWVFERRTDVELRVHERDVLFPRFAGVRIAADLRGDAAGGVERRDVGVYDLVQHGALPVPRGVRAPIREHECHRPRPLAVANAAGAAAPLQRLTDGWHTAFVSVFRPTRDPARRGPRTLVQSASSRSLQRGRDGKDRRRAAADPAPRRRAALSAPRPTAVQATSPRSGKADAVRGRGHWRNAEA